MTAPGTPQPPSDPVAGLRALVQARPDDAALRLQLARLLLAVGRPSEALTEATAVLQQDPAQPGAADLVGEAVSAMTGQAAGAAPPAPAADATGPGDAADGGFDWEAAERELPTLPPPFVESDPAPSRPPASDAPASDGAEDPPRLSAAAETAHAPGEAFVEPARTRVTLADVGGLDDVKRRLDESFLVPMRNTEIARAFGKSLRGGLLLYGPPGCGKTHIGRAVAGELGARFLSVTMTDVLGRYIGETEANLHAIFEEARAQAPAVLFFDEFDALGLRRSGSGSESWMRRAVNQLLLELDSAEYDNSGLYVLAATNHPWDLDDALLRPGRLDRAVLVTPPDHAARTAILRRHLQDRPLAGIDLEVLAEHTRGFSGADLEHLADTAAEKAMMESVAAGQVHPIDMRHLEQARAEVAPSTGPWLDAARSVVRYANAHGRYDDLAEYLDAEASGAEPGPRRPRRRRFWS